MRSNHSIDDLILNYDPESPAERFREAGLPAALKSSTGRLPGPVPWPQGHAPTAAPLPQPPAETDDLSRFRGYDAVVVTWTAAEAAALAALFTPEFLPSRWYEYRHNVADYIPLVTGARAVQRPGRRYGEVLSQPRALFPLHGRWRAGLAFQVWLASGL
jgi:hypothetical protein